MSETAPLYSRSANSCPFGKCTDELKTLVPEEVKEQLTALAVIRGQSTSEYIRDMILEHVYGHIAIMRSHHNKSTAEKGQE